LPLEAYHDSINMSRDRAILNYKGGFTKMAQSDLDSMQTGTRQAADPVEAGDQLEGFGESIVDTDAKARAAAEGVRYAAFIDYDVALDKYADRGDVEDLAHKNARNIPSDFADADFMRAVGGEGSSGPA
jgi:hypothetical protein